MFKFVAPEAADATCSQTPPAPVLTGAAVIFSCNARLQRHQQLDTRFEPSFHQLDGTLVSWRHVVCKIELSTTAGPPAHSHSRSKKNNPSRTRPNPDRHCCAPAVLAIIVINSSTRALNPRLLS
jgi:hypothetical protein